MDNDNERQSPSSDASGSPIADGTGAAILVIGILSLLVLIFNVLDERGEFDQEFSAYIYSFSLDDDEIAFHNHGGGLGEKPENTLRSFTALELRNTTGKPQEVKVTFSNNEKRAGFSLSSEGQPYLSKMITAESYQCDNTKSLDGELPIIRMSTDDQDFSLTLGKFSTRCRVSIYLVSSDEIEPRKQLYDDISIEAGDNSFPPRIRVEERGPQKLFWELYNSVRNYTVGTRILFWIVPIGFLVFFGVYLLAKFWKRDIG